MSSEINGTTVGRRSTAERLIRELPPDHTAEDHDAAMRAAGERPYTAANWYLIRRKVLSQPDPPAPPAEPAAPTPPVPTVKPAPARPNDYLTRFVRFACAVEDVGGTVVARRMLEALDQLTAKGSV